VSYENVGTVMTANGPVDPSGLGITLTHEHVLIDIQCYHNEPRNERQRDLVKQPLAISMLGEIRRDLTVFPQVLVLDDREIAAQEVGEFVKGGGGTIVDCTPKNIGRDAPGVQWVGNQLGMNMVMGCGYYIQPAHPAEVSAGTAASLKDLMLAEIRDGIDGTGIRPGVIGEIGTSQPVHPDEWKVLTAACEVQKESGLPLYVHPYFGTRSRVAPELVRFILRQGVDPQRVNICHMDGYMNLDYQLRVLDMGVNVSFDTFGLEVYYDALEYNHNCHDSQREEHLLELLNRGYADQILISQDVCVKIQLGQFGGYGYNHLLSHIVPSLKYEGVSEATIQKLLVDNPRRLLTIGGGE
jgi:phosphotriesterase-related protein